MVVDMFIRSNTILCGVPSIERVSSPESLLRRSKRACIRLRIHILFNAKPQLRLSDAVKILKGNSARWLFLAHPEIKQQLWGGHLWNPSYCVVTVSDRSHEQVKRYIETQKAK